MPLSSRNLKEDKHLDSPDTKAIAKEILQHMTEIHEESKTLKEKLQVALDESNISKETINHLNAYIQVLKAEVQRSSHRPTPA